MSRNTEPYTGKDPVIHRIALAPGAHAFPAPSDQTVLRSALDAGIDLPASCRNGTCRVCLRRLHSGQVHYRIEWPGLSSEERVAGYILPCVAHPRSDLILSAEA